MVQDGLSFVFVLGAGALLLRPGDFPLFARAAGRLVGMTVHSIRTTKEAAEKAISHSASVAHRQNPDMIHMRENLKQSLEKFQDLANTVRRDMADVPLNPTSLFNKGLRSWDAQIRDNNGNEANSVRSEQRTARHSSVTTTHPHPNISEKVTYSQSPNVKSSIEFSNKSLSGGTLLSRAIEEHALARQKQRLFTHTQVLDENTTSNTPTKDSTDA